MRVWGGASCRHQGIKAFSLSGIVFLDLPIQGDKKEGLDADNWRRLLIM